MNADRLLRRLSILENAHAEQDLVTISHQWLNEDGTPASAKIERRIPRNRIKSLMDG